jgi:mannosyltransferase
MSKGTALLGIVRGIRMPSWMGTGIHPVWAVLVCGGTGLLGVVRLGAKGVWHDEAFSHGMARLDLSSLWHATTRADSFNGLYYSLLHFWQQLGGESETWLRLLSVLAGLLAAYALFMLNRRLFGLQVALIAAALIAVNPFFIRYEQEARSYALAVLLVILATYVFVVALETPSIWRWLGYGAVCGLALYAHLFSGFVILAHLISLAVRRLRPRLRDLAAAYGLAGLLVAPLLVVMLRTDPLQRAFIPRPTLGSLPSLFLNLTGGSGLSSRAGWLLPVAFFVVCCLAIVWFLRMLVGREPAEDTNTLWSCGLMLSWLGVPVMGSFGVSMIRPIFYDRYLIVILPALATLAAIGISSLKPRWLQSVTLAIIVALSLPPLLSYYGADYKEAEDWRGAVSYVARSAKPGDGVVFLSRYGRRPFEYYLERVDARAGLEPIYPGVTWGRYPPVLGDLNIESTTTAAARLPDGYARVWAILLWRGFESIHEDAGPLEAALNQHYRAAREQGFGSALRVRLYDRNSG